MPRVDITERKAYEKAYRELNREKRIEEARRYHLLKKYGITLEQYDAWSEAQDHRCAVCKKHRDEFPRRYKLAVDHDHKTREIFGLLCYTCNHYVVGRYRNPSLFLAAAEYLKHGKGIFVPLKKRRKKRKKK